MTTGLPPLYVVEKMQADKQYKRQQALESRKARRYWKGMLNYQLITADQYETTEEARDVEVLA